MNNYLTVYDGEIVCQHNVSVAKMNQNILAVTFKAKSKFSLLAWSAYVTKVIVFCILIIRIKCVSRYRLLPRQQKFSKET